MHLHRDLKTLLTLRLFHRGFMGPVTFLFNFSHVSPSTTLGTIISTPIKHNIIPEIHFSALLTRPSYEAYNISLLIVIAMLMCCLCADFCTLKHQLKTRRSCSQSLLSSCGSEPQSSVSTATCLVVTRKHLHITLLILI